MMNDIKLFKKPRELKGFVAGDEEIVRRDHDNMIRKSCIARRQFNESNIRLTCVVKLDHEKI